METLTNFLNKRNPQIFVIIKPGFLGLSKEIIENFEDNNYNLVKIHTKRLIPIESKQLYKIHKDKDFYEPLWKYMASDRSTGIIFEYNGDGDVFEQTNKLKDDIREKYGESEMRNVIHSSDSIENMNNEAAIYFNKINNRW